MLGQLFTDPAHRVVVLGEEDAAAIHPAFARIGIETQQVAKDGFELGIAVAALLEEFQAALQ